MCAWIYAQSPSLVELGFSCSCKLRMSASKYLPLVSSADELLCNELTV
jgi:hypothetical protein